MRAWLNSLHLDEHGIDVMREVGELDQKLDCDHLGAHGGRSEPSYKLVKTTMTRSSQPVCGSGAHNFGRNVDTTFRVVFRMSRKHCPRHDEAPLLVAWHNDKAPLAFSFSTPIVPGRRADRPHQNRHR